MHKNLVTHEYEKLFPDNIV